MSLTGHTRADRFFHMDLIAFERIAKALIHENLGREWKFGWDNARTRHGCCYYGRKTITMSRLLAKAVSESEVMDTLLHEIAHGLAGHKAGHGPAWKRECVRLGGIPNRCSTAVTDTDSVPELKAPWMGTCPMCSATFSFYRQPKRVNFCKCSKGKYTSDRALQWTHNGKPKPYFQMPDAYRVEFQAILNREALRDLMPSAKVKA